MKRQLQESAWLLGICEQGYDNLKTGRIHWIDNGKYKGKKWFADPFILDYDECQIILLVEEFDYKVHRGRIAKLTVDRNKWVVEDCKIILDLETHLSFPMIWRENGEIFVFPENYHSGGWNMYRYNSQNEKLELIQQISDRKLTDATIWKNDDEYWLLSTYEPRPNGAELTIWKSKNLAGKYEQSQSVKFDENIARNAGMIFEYNGKHIRPAQESNFIYGHSMSFQELSFKNRELCFKEIYRFHTPHKIYNVGTHTYNQHPNGMAVIDVKGCRYPFFAKIISLGGKLLVHLHLKKQYKPQ